jgi:hypothetical protein
VNAVGAELEAIPNIADAFAHSPFVLERVPGPFADRLPLPLADGTHDGDDQAAGGGAGIERFGD